MVQVYAPELQFIRRDLGSHQTINRDPLCWSASQGRLTRHAADSRPATETAIAIGSAHLRRPKLARKRPSVWHKTTQLPPALFFTA